MVAPWSRSTPLFISPHPLHDLSNVATLVGATSSSSAPTSSAQVWLAQQLLALSHLLRRLRCSAPLISTFSRPGQLTRPHTRRLVVLVRTDHHRPGLSSRPLSKPQRDSACHYTPARQPVAFGSFMFVLAGCDRLARLCTLQWLHMLTYTAHRTVTCSYTHAHSLLVNT